MKKNIWKIVLLLIIVGCILMLLGFLIGAKHGIYMDKTGLHIVNDIEYRVTKMDLEDFTNIDIDIRYADIEFIKSDTYGIDICYYDGDDTIDWSLENGALKVGYTKQSEMRFLNLDFTFLSRGLKKSYVKIYVPSEIELSNMIIKTNNGNIKIDNVKATNIKIENSYGEVAMNHVIATNMQVHNESGNFVGENMTLAKLILNNDYGKITGNNLVVGETNITANSGDIKIEGEFLKETILYSEYGKIELNIRKEKEYYDCHISTDYGKIVIDNEKLKDKLSYSSDNKEGKYLKIMANSGDVMVNFKK